MSCAFADSEVSLELCGHWRFGRVEWSKPPVPQSSQKLVPLRTDPERPDLRCCLSYHPAPSLLHLSTCHCSLSTSAKSHHRHVCPLPLCVFTPSLLLPCLPHQHFRHCVTAISITYHCCTLSLPVPVTRVLSPLSYHNWHAQSPWCPTTAIFLPSPFGSWATSFAAPGRSSSVDLAVWCLRALEWA